MTSVFYVEPELVIALNRSVIFVNPNDLQIFKEIILPEDLTSCGLKEGGNVNNEDNEQGDEKTTHKQNLTKELPTIQHVKMSPNRQLVAITTSGQKAVLLYTLRPELAKLVSIRNLARASSAITFSADSKRLLVCDKTGDCYEYSCEDFEAAPKILLGHLSIVYDVLWSADEKYIVTCDRDDKIRVTNYPETAEIHTYCLGHKEFVAGMALLNENTLLSVSGDKTLKLWNYKEGKELKTIELPAPGIKLALKCHNSNKFELAVLLHQPNECVVQYEITQGENGQWEFSVGEVLNFPDVICCNLAYAGERLYVVGVVNDHLTIRLSPQSPEPPTNWLSVIEEQFKDYTWTPEDISAWFKKKFDNVSEYLERKKRRIEEKQK
ncbi:tRNA (guanine-N(7)-)-methyltransferase non-catalytic subunit wuho [Musca vetustissima]|uniref:tRNA (guanine-N(7)-)-methyltransferase non-catalytic subunit wuho n=1 Tax=Musca vetustissima TaxID=27455 RepID=UPI002AB61C43|nr:tRNA (guanine-N(7)-)-methyltransferase non-catalytic subunit wuho [Musca vetustissima]